MRDLPNALKHPDMIFVPLLSQKDHIHTTLRDEEYLHLLWQPEVSHISIVRSFTRPDIDSAGAAHGNCAKMSPKECPFVQEMLLNILHVVQAVHVEILVVSQYENHIWRGG